MDRKTAIWLCGGALAQFACAPANRLGVGAKNFTEQDILGEILCQHLAGKGIPIEGRLHLGGSFLAHTALLKGDIALYPEYSGTALTACLKLPPQSDPVAVFQTVKTAYHERHQVEWGWRLGFENTFAMAVRAGTPFETLSQAAAQGWRIGVGYEFEQRADGWKSLQSAYGLKLDGNLRTMDLGLLYRALEAKEVDMVAGNSTDAALASGKFTALADDRHCFPPYETCLAVRESALSQFPALRAVLDELAGAISVATMRKLNSDVVLGGKDAKDAARAFLLSLPGAKKNG
jgi:osmoprotectant transport system substrate-binding protein